MEEITEDAPSSSRMDFSEREAIEDLPAEKEIVLPQPVCDYETMETRTDAPPHLETWFGRPPLIRR